MLYMEKFTRLWNLVPSVDKLEVGVIVFLPDRTLKLSYPCLGRVTEVKNAEA